MSDLSVDYTSTTVPPEILALPIEDDLIHVDVLNVGRIAGVDLEVKAAEDKGLVKNHWVWRVLFDSAEGFKHQIQFGFSIEGTPSVPSDAAQYVASSRTGGSSIGHDTGSSESVVYSDVGSIGKPPAVDTSSIEAQVTQLSAAGDNSGSSVEPIAPSILSSTNGRINQPTEGAPVLGCLHVKVRSRTNPSFKVYFTRSFPLKPHTTFGQLLAAMSSRNMEPFRFRKIGAAYLGCRDGISQAAAAWHAENILTSLICVEKCNEHLYNLLGWKYSMPTVSANLTDSELEDSNEQPVRGWMRTVSPIDRAVWPANYVHIEDERLIYNQPTNA